MNITFLVIVLAAVIVAGVRQALDPASGAMEALGTGLVQQAQDAVTLGIGLVGAMALFQGVLKVAEAAGLLAGLARLLRPLLHRLFPDVPPDHPAMGAMVMNVAANMLGLSNAATPFGVRAMQALDRLNPRKGTATNAMVLFLAINTANVTLLPTHVMALRAAAGSHDPAAVILTTLIATVFATATAILVAKVGNRWWPAGDSSSSTPHPNLPPQGGKESEVLPLPLEGGGLGWGWKSILATALFLIFLAAILLWGRVISPWILPLLLAGVLLLGAIKRVPIYEAFVKGAKDGLWISLRIIPYLIAVLVAVGLFRTSGAMDLLIAPLGRALAPLGLPAEALTMAVLRTLSGSASFGYLATLLKDPAIGPDSYLGMLVSTLYGSSETTFYVLAVYFGAAGVRRIRHALVAGLAADIVALIAATIVCGVLYR
ncbi:MAG TPA: nucleoside recognition domain-containing protein [Magnetospirillaceae bacterium]